MADIKKAKAKKRDATEGGASQPRVAITKKPRAALEGPSAFTRAPSTHQARIPTAEEDDDEVEVIPAPAPTTPVSLSMLIVLVAIPKKPSA